MRDARLRTGCQPRVVGRSSPPARRSHRPLEGTLNLEIIHSPLNCFIYHVCRISKVSLVRLFLQSIVFKFIRYQRVMPIDHGAPSFVYSLSWKLVDTRQFFTPALHGASTTTQWREIDLNNRIEEYTIQSSGERFLIKIRSKNRLGVNQLPAAEYSSPSSK